MGTSLAVACGLKRDSIVGHTSAFADSTRLLAYLPQREELRPAVPSWVQVPPQVAGNHLVPQKP